MIIHISAPSVCFSSRWISIYQLHRVDFHQYDLNYFKGIANFGERPTVDGTKLLLEVHLFDFNQNIYGKDLTVEFLTFIRDEIKFSNFDQLTEQIQKDIQIAKNYHGI